MSEVGEIDDKDYDWIRRQIEVWTNKIDEYYREENAKLKETLVRIASLVGIKELATEDDRERLVRLLMDELSHARATKERDAVPWQSGWQTRVSGS